MRSIPTSQLDVKQNPPKGLAAQWAKLSRHAKKQAHTMQREEKDQPTETNSEMTQIIELVDKDI